MPNEGEGDFTRIAIGLQGAFADAEPAAYGFIIEPFVRFGRIADKLFNLSLIHILVTYGNDRKNK